MSAQRMTRGYLPASIRDLIGARGLLQAAALVLFALPLAGCGTGDL